MSSELPDDRTGRPPPLVLHGANSSDDHREPTRTNNNEPGFSTYWHPSYSSSSHDSINFDSHIDPTALQAALPPDIPPPLSQSPHFAPDSYHPFDGGSQYIEESANPYYSDSDRVPLTAGVQPISGAHTGDDHGIHARDSFQTVRDDDNAPIRDQEGKGLGHGSNSGYLSAGHQSYGLSLDPGDFRLSRSPSTSGAFHRAGSIVRAMSQRVVNLSGESDIADQRSSRYRSRSRDSLSERPANPVTSTYGTESYYGRPASSREEKAGQNLFLTADIPSRPIRSKPPNPLKGKTLGIFSPESRFRLWMCDILVNPYTEPFILILIIAQTILLAIESWPDVFSPGNERSERWGKKPIDWTMLGLFIIFTLEIGARIVVSGFILNAEEYSTIDRKRGIRAAIADRYKTIFQPQRQKSVKRVRSTQPQAPAFARSFTTLMQGPQTGPKTIEDQQRLQLARRAFLRHSFNRMDFVAVVSFWITFGLSITGTENRHHFFLFKMLSCLRILRLLALTHGTAIILRSLKKAAPLLVRVAFLISFFWLLFAIIGIQSFKSSLSRQCVWLDPLDPTNLTASFTNSMQFCGGYLDNATGATRPWVKFSAPGSLENLARGTAEGKGYLCPRGSICLQQDNPYNGTVNFDNILHSLELVFVLMSANTFSDLMYYTMGSDYPQAALFFGAAIMIMMLWLTNLLIAVITSSFQVIREESKSSAFTVEAEPSSQSHADERKRKTSPAQNIYRKTSFFWLVVVAFALLTAQLFRGQIPVYDDDGNLIRISFNTIFNSFLGMYQILSSENWTAILYSVTAYTTASKTAWIGAVFLIGWFILSFFILINMFIAVIQENFDVSEDEKRLEQVKAFLQRKELGRTANNLTLSTIFSFGKSRRRKDPLDYGPGMMEMLLKDTVVQEFLDDEVADPLRLNPEHRGPPQRSTTRLMGDGKPGFDDFGSSLFTLFQIVSQEGWVDVSFAAQAIVGRVAIVLLVIPRNDALDQLFKTAAASLPVIGNLLATCDCGSKPWARFLFIAWNIVSMYIFVNLFVSLIFESFSYVYQRSSGMSAVDRDEIRRFKEAWRSVDPAGTGYITKEAFPRLLGELSGVFQMRIYEAEDSVRQILEDVREDIKMSRHTSIVSVAALNDIDINKLNERLSHLDVKKIRKRRHRFNIFYEEVLQELKANLRNFCGGEHGYNVSTKVYDDGSYRASSIHFEDDEDDSLSAQAEAKMSHLSLGADEDGHRKSAWPPESIADGAMQSHPLGFPRSSLSANEETGGISAFSFELETPDIRESTVAELERPVDNSNLDSVQDMLDGSVWIDSIRRSATLRTTDRNSYRYDDLP
ncbi:hypothetical protein TrVFT333_001098 [Trichoderma virens FT-333]|nr:hypothetical protein TrVFT333_001098 [Trichoderma virens FT-333]